MIRILFCLIFASCATIAQAQTQIPVRGGDHAGFTRLVLNLRQSQDWSMVETQSGYRLELPNWGAGFDLSQVFFKITRDRVSAVTATQNAVSFDLACQCAATATQLTSGVIFVDIAPADLAEPTPSDPAPLEQAALASKQVELPQFTSRATDFSPPTEAIETPTAPQLDGLRESLFNGLQRSAALSLIELEDGPPKGLPAPDPLTAEASDRLKISDAFENAAAPSTETRSETDTASALAACPMPEQYDISVWGEPDAFTTQLAALRRDIPAEFDRFNADDVARLAQLYLYFGLGTEARMILRSFDIADDDATRIAALAQIVEPDSHANAQSPFADLAHCAGNLTPWLLLGSPRTATLTDATLRDLTTTFSTWPQHLRSMLGPQLVSTLTTRGFDTPASVIRSLITISQDDQTPTVLEKGAFEDMPLAALRDLIDEGGDMAASALSVYLSRAARDNAPLDPIYVELADAYEHETHGLPVSDALNMSRIIALGHIGRSKDAKTVLQDRLDLGAPVPDALLETLVTQALSRADPFEIASTAMFLVRIERLTVLPDAMIVDLSESVLDAGLPDLSAQIMGKLERPPLHLQAKIEVAQLDPETAIATLEPLADSQAETMRVRLLLNAGRAEQVWAEDQDSLPADQKPQIAWAAKEWAQVEADTLRGKLAVLLDNANDPADPDKPIAQATALEASSAKARALISEMLTAPPS